MTTDQRKQLAEALRKITEQLRQIADFLDPQSLPRPARDSVLSSFRNAPDRDNFQKGKQP
jgi:hypothetical protein